MHFVNTNNLLMLLLMSYVLISCNENESINEPQIDTVKAESKEMISTNAPNSITRTIKQDKNGNIWFATWEGIIKFDGDSFINVTNEVSLSRFFSVLEDSKGNFWFASIGSGVYYYNGNSFRNFTTKDGLANDRVTNIYEDTKGDIWFGTEGGISLYNGESFRNFTIEDGLTNNDVNAIIEDNTGKFWIGTRGDACIYDGEKFTKLTNEDGKAFENVRSIIKDSKGNIWLGGKDGLWRYDGSTYKQIRNEFVNCVYEDSKGNIWTTSRNNMGLFWVLSRYDEKSLSSSDTTITDVFNEEGMFFGILEDNDGNIWFGTLNGVYRYDGTSFIDFKDV